MFYIQKDDKIALFNEDIQRIYKVLEFKPELKGYEILETEEGITILDGKFITQEEYDEEMRKRELARKGSFKLTKADFWIACLDLGVTKAAVKERLALIPDETLRAKTEIRIDDAEFFYRGDEGLIALAKMFGITDEQLDVIFKVK